MRVEVRNSLRSGRAAVIGTAAAMAVLLSGCGSEQAGSPTVASTADTSAAGPSTDASTDATDAADTSESSADESTADSSSADSSTADSSTEESSTEESSTEESSTEESTADSSTEESSTESSSSKAATSATAASTKSKPAGKALPLTKPGTTLKLNQAAVVEYQTGTKDKSYYQHGTFRMSVVKIVKGDPKMFDQLKNKEDFKDYVPYLVFTKNEILTHEGKSDGNPPTPSVIYGVLKDGTQAGKAIGLGTLKGCESEYFDDASIGAVSTKCSVTLAKKGGSPVVGVAFEGDDDVYPDSSDNPYDDNPILWMP